MWEPTVSTYCFWVCGRYLLVTGTFISHLVNMGDQTGVVVCFSSGITPVSCCDGDLWIVEVKYVPLAPVLEKVEA